MSITKLGFTEVDEAFHKAKEHLKYAEAQLIKAQEEVVKMEKCHNCPHNELEDAGSFVYTQTRCKDCGFTWAD